MALLLVLFVVVLISIVSLTLTQSTYLGSRLHAAYVDRFRSEVLLQSTLNVALEIISQDQQKTDPPKDSWGIFTQGRTVPASYLGITDPHLQIGLEITAEESKIPLRWVLPSPGNSRAAEWRDSLARLFANLGFDTDRETDHTGLFANRPFSSKQMVANLIDFMDADDTSYSEAQFATGIEGELPSGYFPKGGQTDYTLRDLSIIPGFSPSRMKRLSPYVTPITEVNNININLAPAILIRSIDPSITPESAQAIVAFARGPEGPFSSSNNQGTAVLQQYFPNYQSVSSFVSFRSRVLQVTAKVQLGDRPYFLRALILRRNLGDPEAPNVLSREFIS